MRFNLWEDCNRVPLTELLSFVVDNRGKTVPTAPSGHKLIATNCVTNNALFPVYEKIRYLSEETYQTWFRAHPIPGDILFVNKGTPGRVCLVPDPVDFCIAQDMIALRADESKIYPKYLFAVLRSREIQQQIYNTNVGDVIPHFKKQFLDQLLIPIPERSIQESIGDLYYVLSLKAERNKKINDNLQQQAAAIFRSWFVDYAPFGGTAPNEWKNVTLEEITALVSRGITPKYADDADQIVINQKCIRNHMIDLSLARSHKPKVINDKWLRFGDLLINSTGDGTLGRVAQVWFQPHNLTVDSHVTIVRPAAENTIFYIGLWGIQHEKEIESLHTGSTGQTELPRDRVKALELLLPDKETLDRFNALIAPMAADIISNQEENNRLASIRDALLPKLMSGKIDVSGIQL